MFITNITYIQNYGVFRDFRWTPDLPEFGKFNLILPNKAEFYNYLNDNYIYALNAFGNTKKTIILALKKIKELLIKKKGVVFESYPFLDQVPEYDANALEKINEIIRKHNTICDNFNNIASKAINDLENDFVAQSLDEDYKKGEREVLINYE